MFLLGRWKNFEELEECLSIPELDFIIKHKREFDNNQRKFEAAIHGIDLEKGRQDSIEERREAVKRKAAIRLAGSEEQLERQELQELGFGFQTL